MDNNIFDYRLHDVFNQPQRVDDASSGTTYIGLMTMGLELMKQQQDGGSKELQ